VTSSEKLHPTDNSHDLLNFWSPLAGVNFALDYDRKGEFRFAALQSEAGRALLQRFGRRPDDISSIVLVDQKGAYIKSEAVLRIAQKLGSLFPLIVSDDD